MTRMGDPERKRLTVLINTSQSIGQEETHLRVFSLFQTQQWEENTLSVIAYVYNISFNEILFSNIVAAKCLRLYWHWGVTQRNPIVNRTGA